MESRVADLNLRERLEDSNLILTMRTSYMNRIQLLSSRKKVILFFIFFGCLLKLPIDNGLVRLIVSMVVIFLFFEFWKKNDDIEMERINKIYNQFEKKYPFLWMDSKLIIFIDSIKCYREKSKMILDSFIELVDYLCKIEFNNKYLRHPINMRDYILLNQKILNEFHSFVFSEENTEYFNFKKFELKRILWYHMRSIFGYDELIQLHQPFSHNHFLNNHEIY